MKKLLWTSAMALTAAACMTACDDSSSGASNSIPEFKTEAALPDTCEMEVAKAGDTYFACFENKWIEVTDSATVEQLKEGLDEDEVKAKLEELEDLLKPATPAKPKSSSSKKTDEDVESSDSEEPESSASEEECTGRRCKTGNSSSSKKSSGGSGSGDSGEGGGEGGSGEGGDSSPSSATSESASSTESKCGTETYDPSTQWCRTADNTVIAIANTSCCGNGSKCGYTDYATSPKMFYDVTKEFCDSRTNAYQIYKMVTIGTQTWMAENLNYETTNGSDCYGSEDKEKAENCATYGHLYTWAAATSNSEPVCPTGWHLPSKEEWLQLKTDVANDVASLQATGYEKWTEATNTSGFNAIPSGIYNSSSGYNSLGQTAFFWSKDDSGSYGYGAFMANSSDNFAAAYNKTYELAVRCIKDTAGED